MGMVEVNDFISQKQPMYSPKVGEELLTVNDYAKRVGLTPSAVRIQLQKGRLDGVRMGKHWRVRVLDDTVMLSRELSQLRTENEVLKTKLSIIGSILGQENVLELVPER